MILYLRFCKKKANFILLGLLKTERGMFVWFVCYTNKLLCCSPYGDEEMGKLTFMRCFTQKKTYKNNIKFDGLCLWATNLQCQSSPYCKSKRCVQFFFPYFLLTSNIFIKIIFIWKHRRDFIAYML